jgi:hypothetical protein
MIIRRRHTANFTTIGNALFEDMRLQADEVGILAYLLSRPNNWEVRRTALMRRWSIGAVAIKRIMTNLMRTGWCRAEKTRLANGTFHIVYEIRDDPGPNLSEDDIRGALSLVSSEVANDESRAETGEQPPPYDIGVESTKSSVHPSTDQGVVDQGVVTTPLVPLLKKDLENTEDSSSSSAREGHSSESEQIADEIAKIAKIDEAKHGKWFQAGPAIVIQRFLDAGYLPWQLIEGAKRGMATRTDAPRDIHYFKPLWQRVRGEAETPAPPPDVISEPRKSSRNERMADARRYLDQLAEGRSQPDDAGESGDAGETPHCGIPATKRA